MRVGGLGRCLLGSLPFPVKLRLPSENHTVGSGLSFEATDNSTISTEMVNMVADHIGELVLTGFVYYDDIFGVQHGSEWCAVWMTSSASGGLSLKFCPGGLLDDPRFY